MNRLQSLFHLHKEFLTAIASRMLASALLALTFTVGVSAQTPAAAPPSSAPAEMADAEVRKVDKDAGKINLRHGPLVSLDMKAMTMVFRVADPKMLDQVKEGDKMRFSADKVNGAFTVTSLQPVP